MAHPCGTHENAPPASCAPVPAGNVHSSGTSEILRGGKIPLSLHPHGGTAHSGRTAQEILADYPYLEQEDITQALQYAAWLAEEREYSLEEA